MSRLKKRSFTKQALIGLPILMLVLLTSTAWWLLGTSSGAAWIWGQVEDVAAGAVSSSRVNGDLASGFSIDGLEYRSDNVSLSVRRVEIAAGPGWWPLSVQVPSFALMDVDIVAHSSAENEQDAAGDMDIPALLESLKLRIPVNFEKVEVSNITLRSGGEAPQTLVDSLSLSASLHERLVLNRLEVQAPDVTASLNGQLGLEQPFDITLAMEAKLELEGQTDGLQIMLPVKLDANGDLDSVLFTLASIENGLVVGDELLDLRVSGSGSSTGLQLNSAALTGSGIDLNANGAIDWSSQPSAGVKLAIKQLDISTWVPAWPVGKQIIGEFDVNWSASGLKIPIGSLRVAGTDLSLNVAADINLEDNSVDAKLDWSNVAWPLAEPSPDFVSPRGKLDMQGSLDDWSVGGQLDVGLGDYPQGRFEIEGKGNLSSAHLILHDGQILGGSVRGEAGADWESDLDWELDLHTRGIDPEPLLPGWPGSLDADVKVAATNHPEKIQVRVDSLQGVIRGVPINGRGGVKLAGQDIVFDGVDIRTEEAVLQLAGNAASTAGVTLKFAGQLPSMLLQGAAGNVELEGRYSSATGSSLLDVQLKALDLAWNGFGIKSIAANTFANGPLGSVPTMQLEATGLAWQEMLVDELSLSLHPDGGQHRLNASAANNIFAVSSSMLLTPEDTTDLFAKPWHGVLDDMVVAIDQSFSFQLQEQAPLKLGAGLISLEPACIREDAGAALCVNADYQADTGWSLLADVKAVPLDYLRNFLELNVRFEQFLEGSLEWHQSVGQAPTGGADFRIAAGRILDLDDNDVLTETSEGRFGFVLRNGNLESGVLDLELPGTGFIDVDFDVLDIIESGEKKLHGRAIAKLDNLELVGQLALPVLDEFKGQFESEIELGGSLENPTFEGRFGLSNGRLRYAPIGLDLKKIAFEGRLEQHNRGFLKGEFKAGEGIGLIDGQLSFEDLGKVEVDATFSGENLLLINTDNLKIESKADLRFGFAPDRMEINGSITVPSARLTPANLILEKVSDSEDLVVETRTHGSVPENLETTSKNQVFGQLKVVFGDDVLIKVPGIETNLSGSVKFDWNGDPVPLANGSYNLQGKVDVYGPTLQIDNGHISFPGVVADNPLLNIKAEREVYGNTQIRSAGVRLIGSLKRPVLEAYTVPITNEDRAWTLLITGTDFDQGQGVGGFDVGTYIAPKLYVSYGISLFDDENVVSARYDLKKGFGVKVTSGQRETGVDISYTVDRE